MINQLNRFSSRIAMLLCAVFLQTSCLAAAVDKSAKSGAASAQFMLMPLPSAGAEALRMDREAISDEQPSGLYLKNGQSIRLMVNGLRNDHAFAVRIGFPAMWAQRNVQQIVQLSNGSNVIKASNLGPLMFIYSHDGNQPRSVAVSVLGGNPMPLYVDGKTGLGAWGRQLNQFAKAPFVSLVSSRSMVTLSMPTYRAHPIVDPARSMAMINRVIGWEDEVAGFDSRKPVHRPTPLLIARVRVMRTRR